MVHSGEASSDKAGADGSSSDEAGADGTSSEESSAGSVDSDKTGVDSSTDESSADESGVDSSVDCLDSSINNEWLNNAFLRNCEGGSEVVISNLLVVELNGMSVNTGGKLLSVSVQDTDLLLLIGVGGLDDFVLIGEDSELILTGSEIGLKSGDVLLGDGEIIGQLSNLSVKVLISSLEG